VILASLFVIGLDMMEQTGILKNLINGYFSYAEPHL
jgi:hypothetical protein